MEEHINCLPYYIDQIKKVVVALTSRHSSFLKSAPLVAYRGEPKDYGETKLTPSLFRENTYVSKEAHLFELFSDYNIVPRGASNIEKAIETQHYASISRMLDISFDILVAIYFACDDQEQEKEDGFVYAFTFPEHYSPHSKYIEDFYTDVLEGKHIAYSRNFKVFSHSHSNDRINAQKGGFIFFPGKEFHPINDCYYDRVRIPKEDKPTILKDLALLFQINEATIFPEKEKIAKVIKERFKDTAYTQKKVSIENEVESVFSRIDYELKILRTNDGVLNKKEILRWLRKEQDDLISYVKAHNQNTARADLIEKIEQGFKVLQIRYKEAQNGDHKMA